jgi:hypothetical protein
MAKKGLKLGNTLKKSLKKFEKIGIFKNSVVLYLTLLLALFTVLVYISKSDWNSLIVLIVVGLLTNYFTKNMTVILGTAIVVSLVVRMQMRGIEGFEQDKEGMDVVDVASKSPENTPPVETEEELRKCWKNVDGEWSLNSTEKEGKTTQVECAKPMCWDDDNSNCKKESFSKKSIPSSKPQSVNGEDDDPSEGDRIDYAKTVEGAYDNLQNMLGKDGIKGLTNETSQLIKQQKDLMDSIKGIGPMMKEAQSMMKSLNGLSLGSFGGKK